MFVFDTQRQAAAFYFRRSRGGDVEALERLREVLTRAQNTRESGGEADGSIDQALWTALRDYGRAERLVRAREHAVIDLLGEDAY